MMENGVGIVRALTTAARTDNKALREVLETLRNSVESGRSLSETMAKMPEVFSHLYLRSIRAAERSGRLSKTLLSLGQQLALDLEHRQRLKAALTYPACVTLLASLMIAFLLYVQVPLFLRFFSESGAAVPFLTRALMVVSRPELALGILAAVGLLALHIRNLLSSLEGRRALRMRLYRFPGLGHIVRTAELAQVANELSVLLKHGVDLLTALKTVSQAPIGSPYFDSLAVVAEHIKDGSSLPDALEKEGIYPRLLSNIVRAGDETGKIWESLAWYGDLASQEVNYSINAVVVVLEPLVIGILGAVVGLIVLASFLPAYELLTTF